MKNLVFGIAVGLVAGYIVRRMEERGQFDTLCDMVGDWTDKAKKQIKNAVDVGCNEAEYIKDRIESKIEQVTND